MYRPTPVRNFFKLLGYIGIIIACVALVLAILALPTAAIYFFWNLFMVVQFGFQPIGLFVSFCISIVLGLIFRGTTVVRNVKGE